MSTCRRMARIVINSAAAGDRGRAPTQLGGALDRNVRRGRSAGVVARNDSQGCLPDIVLAQGLNAHAADARETR